MIFGRKKRPSQSDDHRLADETVSFEEDDSGDDIIDLEDVLEAPEGHVSSNDMFGEGHEHFDVEFAARLKELDAGVQRPTDFMDDQELTEEELLFDDYQADAVNLLEEDLRTVVELDALGGDAAAVDERYNLDEILQAGSSDQLMAELMAVENAPVSEKPDAFLKELLAADQEELSTEEAERGGAFDGKKLQEITDLDGFETASAMNEAIYAEETLFQEQIGGPLVEAGAFDEEVLPISSVDLEPRDFLGTGEMWEAAEAGDADEAPGPEEVQPPLAAAPAVAGLSAPAAAEKAELPPAGPGEVREAVHGEGASEVLNLEDWQLLLAAAPVVVGVSAPAAVVAEKTESREKLTVRPEITLSPTEEIFTIKAMTSGHGVAVSLEEELILGFKPEQRLTVGFESTPAAQYPEYAAPVSDAAAGKTDLAELDRLLEESDLPLDTFMPVSERDAVSEPGEGSLIDLMARMEERLMSNMQAVLESKMHDIVHSVIKEELENLRQSCHQID